MNRVLRLVIYILLDYCTSAFAQVPDLSSAEVDGINVEDRARDGNDKYLEHEKLLGLDYYNDAMDLRNNYDASIEQLMDTIKKGNIVVLDTMDTRNYKAELQAGNKGDLLGTNPHYYQPNHYPDFSRRFVFQYPYKEVGTKNIDDVKSNELVPKLASPDLVLAVAYESALLDAAAPKNPSEKLVTKDILRSGEYWNAVWKEDVDPRVLRSTHPKNLESVRAEIPPGSKLYDLVSKLKHLSPTILYIINENNP